MLFNDIINCKDYIASVKNKGTSMDHWWDDNDREKMKYLEKNLFHCYFVQHQSHKHWPWSEPRPLQ